MSTAFFDIESAMQLKLASVPGAPYIDKQGDKPYTPVIGTRYWRTNHLPANTSQVTADALKEHLGIFQVDLLYPLGKGLKQILNDIDAIATAFDTIASLQSNGTKIMINGVSRGRVTEEPNWLFSFVQINYTCYSY